MEYGHISPGCASVNGGVLTTSSDVPHHVAARLSSSALNMALSTNHSPQSDRSVQSQPAPPQ